MNGTARIAIGALAKHTGTKVETIRYYERIGLWAAPSRTEGGYRIYGTAHLKRLNFIRRARLLGFSIDEVRALLRLADERKRPCAEARVVAEAHLADVRNKIADLKTMERVLKETVAKCADGAGTHCPLSSTSSPRRRPAGRSGKEPTRRRLHRRCVGLARTGYAVGACPAMGVRHVGLLGQACARRRPSARGPRTAP
jgi:MerR family transcriptional regulator, mercuric resistance operon regulatory protein